jgi:predicted ATPase
MARLDRLAHVKELAQTAAVIGREFSHDVLAAICPLAEDRLNRALDQLVASELIFRYGAPLEATYAFKHALVQDAAYQSLLKSRRRQLHAEIGHVLEERFPDLPATKPEVLAHHWRGAENIDRAVHYLRIAATRAIERSSHREAVAHLAAALELIQAQPPSVGRKQTETTLWLSLGAGLIAPRGYAADEVRDAFARARKLSHRTGDREQLFFALRGLWNCHLLRTELREASTLAEQIFELARQSGTAERLLVAHRVMATSLFALGRIENARRLFDGGLAFWDPANSVDYTVAYGEDPGLFCCVYAAWCDDFVGFRDEALLKMRRALDHARRQPNRYGLASALSYATVLHHFRREPECVVSMAQEGIELCREQGIVQWLAHDHIFRGWGLAVEGHHSDGLGELREGIAAWQGIKMQLMMPYFSVLLAQAHAAAGQIDAALQALEETDGLATRTGHESFEAVREHQRGELLLRASHAGCAQAERQFLRSFELARAQGCRTVQLRAATSLARLWGDRGERQKARDLLEPIHGWFSEGFDTQDLKDAKALLDDLQ